MFPQISNLLHIIFNKKTLNMYKKKMYPVFIIEMKLHFKWTLWNWQRNIRLDIEYICWWLFGFLFSISRNGKNFIYVEKWTKQYLSMNSDRFHVTISIIISGQFENSFHRLFFKLLAYFHKKGHYYFVRWFKII